MSDRCPTCGQPLPEPHMDVGTVEELVAALAERDRRQVYRFRDDSGWAITYSGGRVHPAIVKEAIRRGAIHSCYSNCPQDAYWLDRTIDIDATAAARKAKGKFAETIYLPA